MKFKYIWYYLLFVWIFLLIWSGRYFVSTESVKAKAIAPHELVLLHNNYHVEKSPQIYIPGKTYLIEVCAHEYYNVNPWLCHGFFAAILIIGGPILLSLYEDNE